jgi:hypothetical protein
MNDRHAISLRINAAISAHPLPGDKAKRRLSNGGVRRWIEEIDDNQLWENGEHSEGGQLYNRTLNQSVTALQMR